MPRCGRLHLSRPATLVSLNSELLLSILMNLGPQELAALMCASPNFPFELIDEAARRIVARRSDRGRCTPRLADNCRHQWLPVLRELIQLSRPLTFTAAGRDIAILDDGMSAAFKVAGLEPKPATAVCGEYIMRSGARTFLVYM